MPAMPVVLEAETHSLEILELVSSMTILLLAVALTAFSTFAWRRERDRRMLLISVAYGLFALRGAVVVFDSQFESLVHAEVLEYGSPFLVAGGLLLFFLALITE